MTNKALETYQKIQQDDAVVPLKEATKRDGEYTEPYPLGYRILDNALNGGVRDGDLIVGTGISGQGKCFGKGTKILMYNGLLKNVEDIIIGEKLMGDDSTPRNALSLANGKEMMYKVTNRDGSTYTVNESHILSLAERYGYNSSKKRITNISVKDYLKKSQKYKRRTFGYKPQIPLKFQNQYKLKYSAYLLGLWIAAGRKNQMTISVNNKDYEIRSFLEKQANKNNCKITTRNIQKNSKDISLVVYYKKLNSIIEYLKQLDIYKNKHIPQKIRTISISDRLKFLAGYLDGDGYKLKGNTVCYGCSSSNKQIITGMQFIARSLGFSTNYKHRIIFDKRTKKTYQEYSLIIGGDVERIPVKLKRKQTNYKTRKNDWNIFSIKVEKIGIGNYYGFEIDGNKRFLLGDFTVTHNTTMFQNFSANLSKQGFPCLWFSYEVVLDNLYAKFKSMGVVENDDFHIYTPKKNTSGNLKWVKEKIKEGYEKYNTKFIFIDHLGSLSPKTVNTNDQRRIVLRDICQEIKDMAIQLEVIIFLIAHVKKVERREVEMQDLSESSGIYQIADFVFSIQRESFKDDRGREIFGNEGIIRILKNRLTGIHSSLEFILRNNIIIPAISSYEVKLPYGEGKEECETTTNNKKDGEKTLEQEKMSL